MFIFSEETSTKQIFEQTPSLITIKFCVLLCQTTKGKKKEIYTLQYFTDTANYGNCIRYKKSLKLLTILVAFSSDFMKRGTYLFILLQKYARYEKHESFKVALHSFQVYSRLVNIICKLGTSKEGIKFDTSC